MRKRKIKTSIYFFLASLVLFGATFFAIIITQGGSVTDQGVSTNTGVLRLNVYPSNVDFQLYIDSDQVTNLVNKGANVEAGVHTIRIEADLFNSWEKRVNITKGIVTDVMARLYPIGLKMEQVTSTNISEMIFSTNKMGNTITMPASREKSSMLTGSRSYLSRKTMYPAMMATGAREISNISILLN